MLSSSLIVCLLARRWKLAAAAAAVCRPRQHSSSASAEMEIRYPDGKLRRLSAAWLRFNCRCPECHSAVTRQRSVSPEAALAGASGKSPPRLIHLADGSGVRLDWPDGHLSEFAYSQLEALLAPDGGSAGRSLWSRAVGHPFEGQSAIRPVSLAEFESASSGPRTVLRNLWSCGVATVTGVEASEAATEAVVRRLAPVMPSLFGLMWTFTANGSRQDSAYGSDAIGVHNDTTYLHNDAGLQIFHVLEPAPVGGQTCLADGFLAAETLRREEPHHFHLLTSRPVFHHYLEDDGGNRLAHHTRCLDTVLKLDPECSGSLYQIRYNPFDIGSLATLPQAEVALYLAAYAHLGEILNRQESQVWLSLRPGTVLFIDNWRVLHGRSGFSGRRVVSGCYVARDDWMSRARVLGVV